MICDFGLARSIISDIVKPDRFFTDYVVTRWYRAPECLLTDGYYGYKMDLWGVGCVMFEVISLFPLFPGNDELDQCRSGVLSGRDEGGGNASRDKAP